MPSTYTITDYSQTVPSETPIIGKRVNPYSGIWMDFQDTGLICLSYTNTDTALDQRRDSL